MFIYLKILFTEFDLCIKKYPQKN